MVRSVLQIHFARDEEFEAWAQAQRYRSTNAQQGNFASVSLHCCYVVSYLQVQLHNLYLLYPPSPLGCGLVYNWRICKHIREPPTPRLNTTNSWLSLFAVVCSNSRFTARPPRVHVRNGAIRIIPPLLSPHWTGRNYLESGYTPLHSLFLFPFVDLAR